MSKIQLKILAACLVFVGLISVLFALRGRQLHDEVHAEAVARLSGQTLALKAFTEASLGGVEAQLLAVAAHVRNAQALDTEELRGIGLVLAARKGHPAYLDNFVVADAAGTVLYAARSGESKTQANRDYFAIHRNRPDSGTQFGEVEESEVLTDLRYFTMSRRLETRDGKFAGVIVAYLDVEALAREYERLRARPESALVLIAADGTVVTRTPYSREFVGRAAPLRARRGSDQPAVFFKPEALDGAPRLIVQRWLEPYPFAIVASLTEDAVYTRWRSEWPQLALVWCLVALATIAGGLVLARQAGRTSEARATLGRVSRDLDFFKDALDQHAIVGITDVSGEIVYVNDNFCGISQYAREELLGRNHRILNSGRHSKPFFREMWRTIAQGQVWCGEICNRAKDGSLFWVDTAIMPLMDERGKPFRYFSIRFDATRRKQTEMALAATREQAEAAERAKNMVRETLGRVSRDLDFYKYALDHHAIVAITDINGTIVYANDKFCEISKYPRAELLGQNHRILNSGHHSKTFFREMWRTIAQGQVWRGEICNRAKDGSLYWVDTAIVPLLDERGKPFRYFAIRIDITSHVRTEMALVAAKAEAEAANRLKSELIANTSHELRTPLNAVIGFSEVMKGELFGPLAPKYREYAADINNAGRHLLRIVGDILDVSAIEAGKLELREERVDLAEILKSAAGMIGHRAEAGAIEFREDIPEGLPRLFADERRVKQIALNLLSNAIKFNAPGGSVTLAAGLAADGSLFFRVTDTGIGMDEDEIAVAMSKFGQVDSSLARRHEGTGLGLPLAHSLAELHGGTFTIASAKEKGTTITVTFPRERTVGV